MIKTLALVGVSAGVGAFVGDKVFAAVSPKLPADKVGPAGQAGIKLGLEAAGAVLVYGVLSSIV